VSCSTPYLTAGTHTISGSVPDNSGRSSSFTGSFTVHDTTVPTIVSIQPTGAVHDVTKVEVVYSDVGSGINTSSLNIMLDGTSLTGCTVSVTSASCPISGLETGLHTIGGSVSDNSGNAAPIINTFSVIPAPTGNVSPHGGYSTTTNACMQCHDVHDSSGDYVLSREATITGTCGTCHGLFGTSPRTTQTPAWTEPPPDFTGTVNYENVDQATVSQYAAYKVDMTGMLPSEEDAVSGHSLGVMYNGSTVRNSDQIPGGSNLLKGLTSGQPNGLPFGSDGVPRYNGESVTAYESLKGLNCASCHTPHGANNPADADGDQNPDNSWGQQFTDTSGFTAVRASMLLSNRPNHSNTPVRSYNEFCQSCHDLQGSDNSPSHDHPPLCVSCHGNPNNDPSSKDFPHTSSNPYLLTSNGDELCIQCHVPGSLP
jgi:predicted CXXCH cytochrome family protein